MALALKFFADGQLSNSAATSMYAPTGSVCLVSIILCNTTAGAITVNLYVKKGAGTARRIYDKDYSIPAGESRTVTSRIILENGDTLRGDASAATSVDYSVFGFTE